MRGAIRDVLELYAATEALVCEERLSPAVQALKAGLVTILVRGKAVAKARQRLAREAGGSAAAQSALQACADAETALKAYGRFVTEFLSRESQRLDEASPYSPVVLSVFGLAAVGLLAASFFLRG